MQQIVFKKEFSVLFDAVKTENLQYLEKKIQPIKKIAIKKNRLRTADRFSKNSLQGVLNPYQIWYQ